MNKRKFILDIKQLIFESKSLVPFSDHAKFMRKVTIVTLMLGGIEVAELATACGESSRTFIRWMKAVDEKGFDAVLTPQNPSILE